MKSVTIYTTPFCGYCFAAKRLLAAKGVAFEEIDVSADPARRGEMVQRAMGRRTVPQVFIGGQHIGGCTDLFDAMRAGTLQQRLEVAGVAFDRAVELDPYSLLPKWMHPRKAA